MNHRLSTVAAAIVKKADREHTADAVMRAELKAAPDLSHEDRRDIAGLVFAYYRWLKWLDARTTLPEQLHQADALNRRFKTSPETISAAELTKAVPPWTAEQITISTEWLQVLQSEPFLWLRAKKGTGKTLAQKLGECWIPDQPALADAIRYDGGEDLFHTKEFRAGEFELQDISSQIVGLLCDPKPGETWWDACAGEGGKTLHLCDLMQNKGLVWVSDRAEWRLKKLKKRMARAGLFNYRSVLWSNPAKPPVKTKFDGILVDAPCSGAGVWQRNPQARWTTRLEDIQELSELQKAIAAGTADSLKPGGKLIYSVCTLTTAETIEVAEAISQKFPELKPLEFVNPLKPGGVAVKQLTLWPQEIGGNGMFICGWQKPAV